MQRDAAARVLLASAGLALASCTGSRSLPDCVDEGAVAVHEMLRASVDPDAIDGHGRAALHVAARRKDADTIDVLLAGGARVDQRDAQGRTALDVASEAGCEPCVYALLRAHADPSASSAPYGDRPLHIASRHGRAHVVEMLLEGGADPNAANVWGETPLHVLAESSEGQVLETARVLLAKGADTKHTDARGDTPVHAAALHDVATLIAYYASVHADLDAANAWGATPLDRALERRRDRAADLLYRLGARTRITEGFEPPLFAAARIDDAGRARDLLAWGADPTRTFAGFTPFEVARTHGSDAVAALLAQATRPAAAAP